MVRLGEGEQACGAESGGGPGVAELRVDPVPGIGGEDNVELEIAGLPIFKAGIDDGDLREVGELAAGKGGEVRTHFDTNDLTAPVNEGDGGLARAAADFEDLGIGRVDGGLGEQVVENMRRDGAATLVVEIRDLVEGGGAADARLFVHGLFL